MERSGGGSGLGTAGQEPVGFRPLYRQVYDRLLRRLADAVWQPGQILPSEGQFAAELGASQGTVRKAHNALTADSHLVRRQGRGTFVADHDGKQSGLPLLQASAGRRRRRTAAQPPPHD